MADTAPSNMGGVNERPQSPRMLTAGDVAAMLQCGKRTAYRLAARGKIPQPVRLGALVRWSRPAIDEWIAAGCPAVRNPLTREQLR